MIKVTDYICNYLAKQGIRDIFMISGGGAMHLVDSIGKHPKLKYICPHHEQAAAMAAEGYSRATGKLGVVAVTSGPGGTNTLTGVIGQWLDSVPVLYLSGQVKQETTIESCRRLGLRQLGDQEINIVDIVRPVTKYAVFVKDPNNIRYYLKKAIYLATHGRPGPVWLDIPLDVQGAMVDEKKLLQYNSKEDEPSYDRKEISLKISCAINLLKGAKRPVCIAGHGIRIAHAQKDFLEFIDKVKMPVVSTFNGFDLVPSGHPLFIGRIGTVGDRAGNFALQNADVIIAVGSRNNIRQVSYSWRFYARVAKKIIIDIDKAELKKHTLRPDIAIHADAGYFLKEAMKKIKNIRIPPWNDWLKWCEERRIKYPVVLPEYAGIRRLVQPYYFVKCLTERLGKGAIVVAANGSACVTLFQAGIVRKGQRMFWNSGCAAMGYELPAAIGVCIGSGKRNVVCLAGDGSLQMNIQELQTVFHHRLPIKIFYLNNYGYVSIKQTQDSFFNGHRVACDDTCGVTFPDIIKIARAYKISAKVIKGHREVPRVIREVLASPGPVVCEVRLVRDYTFNPKLSSERLPDGSLVAKPLEDMYPFLGREELKKNMLISSICKAKRR